MKHYPKAVEWTLDHIPYGWRMIFIKDNWILNVKSWWQRRIKGYANEECWNLNCSTAEWMIPRLKYFRDNLHGTPFNREKEFDKETSTDDQTLTLEEWKDILDKMIYAFEFVLNEDDILTKCYPADYDWGWTVEPEKEDKKESSRRLIFNDDRKPDYTYFNECEARHKEGLRLFALYYRNLWD
jgi:hypothetical protein